MTGFLAVLAVLAVIVAALAWLGARVRRTGGRGGEGFIGPFEELWHPAAHRARAEVQVVEERMVPMPSADGRSGPR